MTARKNKNGKVVIIDGHAILHRAYHALPFLTRKGGKPTNAIYGFYSMLLSVIKETSPSWLIICLDAPGPNFRHQQFVGYQAKRPPMEESLASQMRPFKKSLDKASLVVFSKSGFEADDLIGTICQTIKKRKIINKIIIVTGDKDLMQLVDKKVNLLVPGKGISQLNNYDPGKVKQTLGIKPSQVIDLKALMGDPSDNYPGVGGIGPKTAADLLQKYQDLDQVYSRCGELSENMRKKLKSDKKAAYLSRKLAKVKTDVPMKINLKKAVFNKRAIENLRGALEENNFRSLVKRLDREYNLEKETQMKLI
jgi:DNA polymerase I